MSLRLTGQACPVMSASRSRISRRHRPQPAHPLALAEMLCLRPLRPNRAAAQRAREVLMRKRASLLSDQNDALISGFDYIPSYRFDCLVTV